MLVCLFTEGQNEQEDITKDNLDKFIARNYEDAEDAVKRLFLLVFVDISFKLAPYISQQVKKGQVIFLENYMLNYSASDAAR